MTDTDYISNELYKADSPDHQNWFEISPEIFFLKKLNSGNGYLMGLLYEKQALLALQSIKILFCYI